MLLNEMEIFYYVIELKSFSQAATRLGVSKAFVSKHINKLENDLQTRLLTRSTRNLTLTEAGKLFFQQCRKVVNEANSAFSNIAELQNKPKGLLKISVPPAFAFNILAPMLPEFLAKHPDILLDLKLENVVVDIIKEGYDLAIRAGELQDSNLIARKFMTVENIIVVSKQYLQQHKPIETPEDLLNHNCAAYSYTKRSRILKLTHGKQQIEIITQGNFLCNQVDMIKQMVLANVCVGVLPRFMVENAIKQGNIVQCLTEYHLPSSNIYFIYPERDYTPLKTKVFMNELKLFLENNR